MSPFQVLILSHCLPSPITAFPVYFEVGKSSGAWTALGATSRNKIDSLYYSIGFNKSSVIGGTWWTSPSFMLESWLARSCAITLQDTTAILNSQIRWNFVFSTFLYQRYILIFTPAIKKLSHIYIFIKAIIPVSQWLYSLGWNVTIIKINKQSQSNFLICSILKSVIWLCKPGGKNLCSICVVRKNEEKIYHRILEIASNQCHIMAWTCSNLFPSSFPSLLDSARIQV